MDLCKGRAVYEGADGRPAAAWENGELVTRTNCTLTGCNCTKTSYEAWWVRDTQIELPRASPWYAWDEHHGPEKNEDVGCFITKSQTRP